MLSLAYQHKPEPANVLPPAPTAMQGTPLAAQSASTVSQSSTGDFTQQIASVSTDMQKLKLEIKDADWSTSQILNSSKEFDQQIASVSTGIQNLNLTAQGTDEEENAPTALFMRGAAQPLKIPGDGLSTQSVTKPASNTAISKTTPKTISRPIQIERKQKPPGLFGKQIPRKDSPSKESSSADETKEEDICFIDTLIRRLEEGGMLGREPVRDSYIYCPPTMRAGGTRGGDGDGGSGDWELAWEPPASV